MDENQALSEERPLFYTLDQDHNPMPTDMVTANTLIRDLAARTVGETPVGDARVSTVFLAIDHSLTLEGEPVLFQTLVIGGPLNGLRQQYYTWAQAEIGHIKIVRKVEAAAKRANADSIYREAWDDLLRNTRSNIVESFFRPQPYGTTIIPPEWGSITDSAPEILDDEPQVVEITIGETVLHARLNAKLTRSIKIHPKYAIPPDFGPLPTRSPQSFSFNMELPSLMFGPESSPAQPIDGTKAINLIRVPTDQQRGNLTADELISLRDKLRRWGENFNKATPFDAALSLFGITPPISVEIPVSYTPIISRSMYSMPAIYRPMPIIMAGLYDAGPTPVQRQRQPSRWNSALNVRSKRLAVRAEALRIRFVELDVRYKLHPTKHNWRSLQKAARRCLAVTQRGQILRRLYR